MRLEAQDDKAQAERKLFRPRPVLPERISRLYDDEDRLHAILEDVWATGDAKRAAALELREVETALRNAHA